MNNNAYSTFKKDEFAQQRTITFFVLILTFLIFVTFGDAIHVSANTITNENSTNIHKIDIADSTDVYTVVDEMPEIIGGLPALYQKIKYPRAAIRDKIEGRVFIQFVVDENGNATNAEVLRDIGGGCGEAALEAIKDVKFTPGIHNGAPVKVRFSLPVTFRIEGS